MPFGPSPSVGWKSRCDPLSASLPKRRPKGKPCSRRGGTQKRVDVLVRRGGCYYDMFGFGHLIATILIWQKSGDRYTKI